MSDEIIITQLDFPENVRTRSGMYLGSLENSNVLLREIVDNSIDEIYSTESQCDSIWIDSTDEYHVVADNGRGIPIRKSMKDESMTMAVQSVTSLHAGSKFQKKEIAIGMNGVGSSCCMAVSEKYHIYSRITPEKLTRTTDKVKELCKNKDLNEINYYHAYFEKGYLISETVDGIDSVKSTLGVNIDNSAMTVIAFKPDDTIVFSRDASIPPTLRYLNYIVNSQGKKVKLFYNGSPYSDTFVPYKNNLESTITSSLSDSINPSVKFLISYEIDEKEFTWNKVDGSVNGLPVDRGYHIKLGEFAFNSALSRMYNKDFKNYALWGIRYSIVLLAPEPSFSSQTKENCSGIPGINAEDLEPLIRKFMQSIRENKDLFDAHVTRIIHYISSLKNLSKIDIIKSKIPIVAEDSRAASLVPYNVKDCLTYDRKEAELFLCFDGDTKVKTNLGNISFKELTKEFDQLKNVEVVSIDTTNGRKISTRVKRVGVTGATREVVKVSYEMNGVIESVVCTPTHEFMTVQRTDNSLLLSYSEAKNLMNDKLLFDGVNSYKVISVDSILLESPIVVYCLEVDHPCHNFALSTGVIVHNCEGRSAGDNLVQARDIDKHAVLGLRGKPLNSTAKKIEDLLDNGEIHDIIAAIGVGVDEYHNLNEVRYGKVVILADSDPDGCFHEDTEVHTLKYGPVKFKELSSKFGNSPFYVWSRDENGNQVPGFAHSPRITKHVDRIAEVTLDNDEVIKCTIDHPFMMKDGSYKNASELVSGDSVMSFRFNDEFVDGSINPIPNGKRTRLIKSVNIINLDSAIPMWDITVDKYHNYALSSGVYVHNCNINALLLGLFTSHMKFLIEAGYVYVCSTPLYEQDGKYYWADDTSGINWDKPVVHFKGLGELTADQLREFAFNPEVRRLIKITPEGMVDGIKYLISPHARRDLLIGTGNINIENKLTKELVKELNEQ